MSSAGIIFGGQLLSKIGKIIFFILVVTILIGVAVFYFKDRIKENLDSKLSPLQAEQVAPNN